MALGHSNAALAAVLKEQLALRLQMRDLGRLEYFTGLELRYVPGGIHLSQRKYAGEVLGTYRMSTAQPAPTPIDPGQKPTPRMPGEPECSVGADVYRSSVGSLQYLVATRPDIAYAVGVAARYVSAPAERHWQLVSRILRYVQGTQTYGLFFSASSEMTLHAFTDADWAGDLGDRRSTSGYICMMGNCVISYASKKQNVVALSTCEAEYIAGSLAAQEVLFLRQLLSGLGRPQIGATTLHMDNQSAISFATNPMMTQKAKHIDIRHHFIRDHTEKGTIAPLYCKSGDNLADIFTKALAKPTFFKLRATMGVIPPEASGTLV